MIPKLSEWFDGILKKHLPRGITVVQIDTADLFELTSGIKALEQDNERNHDALCRTEDNEARLEQECDIYKRTLDNAKIRLSESVKNEEVVTRERDILKEQRQNMENACLDWIKRAEKAESWIEAHRWLDLGNKGQLDLLPIIEAKDKAEAEVKTQKEQAAMRTEFLKLEYEKDKKVLCNIESRLAKAQKIQLEMEEYAKKNLSEFAFIYSQELKKALGGESSIPLNIPELFVSLTKEQTQELIKACVLIADPLSQALIKKACEGDGVQEIPDRCETCREVTKKSCDNCGAQEEKTS